MLIMKKKFIYISSIAAPHQVRLAVELNKYMDTEFWFYDKTGHRPDWWQVDLPDNCKILEKVLFKKVGRYYSPDIVSLLEQVNPDIVMIGGFFIPSNYFVYRWAKKRGIKTIVFTETFRKNGKLRKKSFLTKLTSFLYRGVDSVWACNKDACEQMESVLPKLRKRIVESRYAADIDRYFEHPLREKKKGYTYLFANRLTDIYNPLLAIEIFKEIVEKSPSSKLKMNRQGELFEKCQYLIKDLCIEKNVTFLDDIKSWDEMHLIYKDSDILLFPAKFSNGNFTIMEAMASGMGIVISDRIKGQSHFFKEENNGFLSSPEKESFIKKVYNYIENPDLFEKHAEINRELAMPLSAKGTAKDYFLNIKKLYGDS